LKLFRSEHRNVLRSFYGGDAEGYEEILEGLASVLEKEVLPRSPDFDRKRQGISSARKLLFERGVCQIPHSKDAGGMGLPYGLYALAMELVGAADGGLAMSMGIHNAAAGAIARFGNDQQRKRFLVPLIAGRKLASFALTEPSSGSDAKNMQTKAIKRGSRYVINGTKMFITNAGESDLYVVFASAEKGHAALMVEKGTPGFTVGEDIQKLGMNDTRTAELRFEDCEVPAENLVGEYGGAFEYVKELLTESRVIMGTICVGIATTAFDKAVRYSLERRMFGQRLSDMQLTREKIADMKIEINGARLLCIYASRLKEMGVDYASEAAQGKVLATEMAARVCDKTIQLLGGYGYTSDDVHRHWRDARLLTIGEGASEVLRMLIAAKELARSP
jgi:butyryl-CoA dehydrogenase